TDTTMVFAAWVSANRIPLIGPRLWLPAGDPDRPVLQPRRLVGLLVGQRVAQVPLVVPLREVAPGVGAARLLAGQRGVDDGLGAVEQELQLQRLDQLSVEGPAPVVEAGVPQPLAQSGQLARH